MERIKNKESINKKTKMKEQDRRKEKQKNKYETNERYRERRNRIRNKRNKYITINESMEIYKNKGRMMLERQRFNHSDNV